MNNNAVLPFCQFPTQRPFTYEWVMEFVEACNMNASEFAVLSRILSKVQRYNAATDTWDNGGYCSLSIHSIADTFSMDREIVQRSIKVLELAGISLVQRRYGSTNTITVTPHTEWIVSDFRELREIVKGKRSPSPIAHVTDTATDTATDIRFEGDNIPLKGNNIPHVTPSPDTVTDTATPSPSPNTVTPSRSPIPLPILKPKLDTVTDTNGNGYRHNAYANNLPSPVIGSPCPEDIKAKYCKRSPSPDTVTDTATDTATPLTLPVMDSSGKAIDTVTLSASKSKSKSKRKYSPSPYQYEDSDNDSLPIFGMSYLEYRESDLFMRK